MQVTGFLYFLFFIISNPVYTPDAILVESLIFIYKIASLILGLLSGILTVHGKFMAGVVPKVTIDIL